MERTTRRCRICLQRLNPEDKQRFLLRCSKCNTDVHNTCHLPIINDAALKQMLQKSARYRQQQIRAGEGSVEAWVCSQCRPVAATPDIHELLSSSDSDNDGDIQIIDYKPATGTRSNDGARLKSEDAPHATLYVQRAAPSVSATTQPPLNADPDYLRKLFPLQRSYRPLELFSLSSTPNSLSQWIGVIPLPTPTPRRRKEMGSTSYHSSLSSGTSLLVGSSGKWATWADTR